MSSLAQWTQSIRQQSLFLYCSHPSCALTLMRSPKNKWQTFPFFSSLNTKKTWRRKRTKSRSRRHHHRRCLDTPKCADKDLFPCSFRFFFDSNQKKREFWLQWKCWLFWSRENMWKFINFEASFRNSYFFCFSRWSIQFRIWKKYPMSKFRKNSFSNFKNFNAVHNNTLAIRRCVRKSKKEVIMYVYRKMWKWKIIFTCFAQIQSHRMLDDGFLLRVSLCCAFVTVHSIHHTPALRRKKLNLLVHSPFRLHLSHLPRAPSNHCAMALYLLCISHTTAFTC